MAGLGQHQVDRGIAAIDDVLSDLGEASLLGLDAEATGVSLVALARLEARVAELRHRVLAHGAEVAVEQTCGATTTATWFAHATRTTVRASRRAAFFAEALGRYEVLRAGMAAGAVNLEQGEVIARALDALPAEVASWVRVEAEQTLVELAARHDAQHLRVLGERILHVVAPEVGEAHEAKQLADAEAAAEKATTLSLTPDGTGKVHGRFTIPELHAGMLRKFLMSLVVGHQDPAATGTPADRTDPARPEPQRRATSHELGQAFCELLERLDGTGLPETAGTGATVVVTMSLETLTGGLAAATLDTGDRIAAHTARRLACEAQIIPVVLGGRRQVLDQGRRRRRFTRAQRIALVVRDAGCTAVGCRTAAWFCHAHHDDPWARGGPTDLTNGRLLCPAHHRRVHDPAYDHRTTPDNQVEFVRRT
ncbi:unannotated protein [freshwater metagenome]|uniref:Unannotated protein n=1 Tax=freshwater metagenome TaxID=449393 RepID=A0A6J6W0K7_9ZZZZ|nr:DUF222 domain-containing protein [Actinomycetota bacterium]